MRPSGKADTCHVHDAQGPFEIPTARVDYTIVGGELAFAREAP